MKFLTFIAAMAISAASFAGPENQPTRLTAAGDVYSQLCMAALESKYVLKEKAKELGVNHTRLRQLTCNGMSPREFRAEYGTEQIITQVVPQPKREQ